MRKFKCEVCTEWHGGFHLCVGPTAMKDHPELKKGTTIYGAVKMSKSDAAQSRWLNHRRSNRERDEAMVKLYTEENLSLREVGRIFDVGYYTVRAALRNLDVPARPKGGPNHHQKELT